jgi:hypothetical protein
MNDGEYFMAIISSMENDINQLKVEIAVVSCAGLPSW